MLNEICAIINQDYRLAEPDEESKGIDGYIGDTPVSIKPKSDIPTDRLQVVSKGVLILYEKKGDGIEIEFNEHDFS